MNSNEVHRLAYVETLGVLGVEMLGARNLTRGAVGEAMEAYSVTSGAIDAYMTTSYGMKSFRSSTVKDDLNPEWNQLCRCVPF